MSKENIHNYDRRLERTLNNLKKSNLSEADKKVLIKFHDSMFLGGLSVAKIERYLYDAYRFALMLNADLENAMRIGALDLSGTYEDTGLVLRTDGNPNSYLAGNLMKQVKERLGKGAKMPVMIPFYGIELVKDQDSPHGLAFKLKDDTEINYVPILNKSNSSNFNSEDIDDKTGLPTKVGKGNRTLWTRDSGLSRLYLNRNLNLNSNNDNLTNSNDNGRMAQWLRYYNMKTYNKLYEEICSMNNLANAWRRARKGKTKKPYVIEFKKDIRENLLQLRKELLEQTYKPEPLKTFILRDPKTRKISKSAFRDRIVHHALIRIIEPIFDKTFIYDNCANRKGRGILFALERFDKFKRKITCNLKKEEFCLKADIKHYFQEINHDVLLGIIRRKISDEKTIWLIKQILSNAQNNRGGNGF